MSNDFIVCRLCKGTEFLSNLFEKEDDQSLHEKINFCIDLKINPEDGLPSKICKHCKKICKQYYFFKVNCLQVDSELRNNITEVNDSNNGKIREYFEGDFIYQTNNYDESLAETQLDEDSNSSMLNFLHVNIVESHVTQDEPESSIQCELCGSIYNSKIDYRKHLSIHKQTKLFKCKLCPKSFTRVETREIHMRSHLGIRPCICEICGKSSTKQQDLIRHMKIHSDERNHECHTCGRRFKRSMDLHTHARTHTGVRPYKCSICDKDYTSHSGLRKHKAKSHFKLV